MEIDFLIENIAMTTKYNCEAGSLAERSQRQQSISVRLKSGRADFARYVLLEFIKLPKAIKYNCEAGSLAERSQRQHSISVRLKPGRADFARYVLLGFIKLPKAIKYNCEAGSLAELTFLVSTNMQCATINGPVPRQKLGLKL